MNIVHVWTGLVGLVIILYVVLDGFSLGVALLFPTARDENERDVMMNSVAPVWDANQTWLVFGGGALFASFPVTYSVLFSALYIPLLTFIFGLIFRGVAFEFRASSAHKTTWNRAFFGGSLVATFAQGLTLGGYLSGIEVTGTDFSGGALDWLNPFSVMVGIALIFGYMLLGSTYLIMKTEGPVQERAFRQAFRTAWIIALFLLIVSVWTPFHDPEIWARWFSKPRIYFVWSFPLMAVAAFLLLIKTLQTRNETFPFFCAILIFISAYLGLETAIYPYAVLPRVTVFEAAAQRESLIFMLWGVAIVIPVVLGYTVYSYWVFRGKVAGEEGYH